MHITLPPRLRSCADFVVPGDRVADVGCDHGYLSIYLLQNGIASHVFASDLREGPLQSAVRNAQKYGVEKNIEFHLSDGLQNVPRDFDTLVCAGMGADTMVTILQAAPWLKSKQYRLVLQCQSKTPMLRKFLTENGWRIAREQALRDGRFLYTVMEVIFQESLALTPGQCWFSPALAREQTREAREYLLQTITKLERAVWGRGEKADPALVAALSELTEMEKAL